MNKFDTIYEKHCIPIGTAVSAKFRGAFCEAIVNGVEKIIECRIQLNDKKTVKITLEDIIGDPIINNKVKFKSQSGSSTTGILVKIVDNSLYHVVFNDDDTGKLRRNQLVLKGDRHYKESESLDKLPLTNPEHFIKAVICDKPCKDRSDNEEDDFDDQKSCSQESQVTVSSCKTRFRQHTHTSSPSVGTVASSLTVKIVDENKSTPKTAKTKKGVNTKYVLGSLVIVNKFVEQLPDAGGHSGERSKKSKVFIALIVSPSSIGKDVSSLRGNQCIVRSFQNNNWYLVFKKDITIVTERDIILKHKDLSYGSNPYIEKCILYIDLKILPENWDSEVLLSNKDFESGDNQTPIKNEKSKISTTNSNSCCSLSTMSDEVDNVSENMSDIDEDQGAKDEWVARFYGFWEDKGSPINDELSIKNVEVDIYKLFNYVSDYGGFQKVNSSLRWPYIYHTMKLPSPSTENYHLLQLLYKKYIFPFVDMSKKLGIFEQGRNRKSGERENPAFRKARLSAREIKKCNKAEKSSNKKSETALSTSSHSIEEQVPLDDLGTSSSVQGDVCQLSTTTASTPSVPLEKTINETAGICSATITPTSIASASTSKFLNSSVNINDAPPSTRLSPGTLVSVSYGENEVYKAKIIQQDSPDKLHKKGNSANRASVDSISTNGESVPSDQDNTNIGGIIYYKVHYIGWNNRHDEIIAPDRIIEVLSDTGQDNTSSSSSIKYVAVKTSQNVLDQEQSATVLIESLELKSNIDKELKLDTIVDTTMFTKPIDEDEVADVQLKNETEEDKKDEVNSETLNEQSDEFEKNIRIKPKINLKRRRSKSACLSNATEPKLKKLDTLPESRIISSLNLCKSCKKMPDSFRDTVIKTEKETAKESCEKEDSPKEIIKATEDSVEVETSSSSCKYLKLEADEKGLPIETIDNTDVIRTRKLSRQRSPSFTSESLSDTSTIPFRFEEEEYLFYMDSDAETNNTNNNRLQIRNKRGKRQNNNGNNNNNNRPDKLSLGSVSRSKKISESCALEVDSNSSHCSSSVNSSRRVTRSSRNYADQSNQLDDSSVQLEYESQTSQDECGHNNSSNSVNGFQLPTSMTPLATGTPTSQYKSTNGATKRHQNRTYRFARVNAGSGDVNHRKSHSRCRNSLSNSSADNNIDINQETPLGDVIPANFAHPDSNSTNCNNNNYAIVGNTGSSSNPMSLSHHNRISNRPFQRLHPSLVPVELDKLTPVERVKKLEALVRQTHLNFLDTKEKLKYVEKKLMEIKACRSNGHTVESDEEKFR